MSRRDQVLWFLGILVSSTGIGLWYHFAFGSNWVEVAAFVTGVLAVYLVVRESYWNWPLGIFNVLLYFWVFMHSRLYADMTLQLFFLVFQVHGWWSWAKGGQGQTELRIQRIEMRKWLYVIGFIVVGTAVYIPIITHYKGSSPFWDSLLTVVSMAAQLLLNRKILENWILWIIADICYIPLFLSRGLYPTELLYGIFLVLAISGFVVWKKSYSSQEVAT